MTNVSSQELKRMLDSGESFVLLNAQSSESFLKEHIPGSINIDAHSDKFTLEANNKLADKNVKVVVYCGGLTCMASKTARNKLKENGYTNVILYEGGIEEWKEMGYKLEGLSEVA